MRQPQFSLFLLNLKIIMNFYYRKKYTKSVKVEKQYILTLGNIICV